MTEKYRVINGFDCKNEPCKLIEYIETKEQYSTENNLEANSLCKLLNEKEERIQELEQALNDFTPITFKNEGEDLILYEKNSDMNE